MTVRRERGKGRVLDDRGDDIGACVCVRKQQWRHETLVMRIRWMTEEEGHPRDAERKG